MINIAEILKNCPEGTKLYSPAFGECVLSKVLKGNIIEVIINSNASDGYFNEYDQLYFDMGECLLFPSKNNRDWNTFPRFKPFDKVVARSDGEIWTAELFSRYNQSTNYPYSCIGSNYSECLPYNERTAKLIGTDNDYDYTKS